MDRAGRQNKLRKRTGILTCVLTVAIMVAAVPLLSGCGDDDCDLVIETELLPTALVGQSYDFEMESDCGGYWFLQEGNLPPGISFELDGDLVGTPTLPGEYVFTVGLEGFLFGDTVYKGFSLRVE